MKLILTSILIFYYLTNYSQPKNCEVFSSINNDFFKSKYKQVYFIDTLFNLKIENEKEFKELFKYHLSDDLITRFYKSSKEKITNYSKEKPCLKDSIKIVQKKDVYFLLNRNQNVSIDSIKERAIQKKINKILSLKESPQRDSSYNKYMRTDEVVKLRKERDFNTVRIVSLSRPIFINEYAIIEVISTTGVRENAGFLTLYKNNKNGWNLVKSVPL